MFKIIIFVLSFRYLQGSFVQITNEHEEFMRKKRSFKVSRKSFNMIETN
jgi:hypothetical protein